MKTIVRTKTNLCRRCLVSTNSQMTTPRHSTNIPSHTYTVVYGETSRGSYEVEVDLRNYIGILLSSFPD